MPEPKLLSIVIPTKDRYKYLKQLISYFDSFDTKNIEVVLQDNTFDNGEILDFLNQENRDYVKYYHTKELISISDNVDLSIKNSTGEYVCFIGDDDGVLPNIVDCAKWMKQKNIEALRPAILIYNWPDYLDFDNKGVSAALLFDDFSFEGEVRNPIEELQTLASRGFRHIHTIPKVYQGIVKRSCLDQIYRVGGTFTPGPSPDMATAVALCFVVKSFVTIHTPVIFVGQSQNVGGGERKLKGGVKNIEDVAFLPANAKQNWDKRIPKVWCSQTVWPESAIKAIQYMQGEKQIVVNYEFILAWFIITHPSVKGLAFKLSRNKIKLTTYLAYYKIAVPVFGAITTIKSLLNAKAKHRTDGRENLVPGVNNIEQAGNYLTEHYPNFMRIDDVDIN